MRDLLRQRLNDAFSDGFVLLRRIPSTTVWRTLGFLDALSESERASTLDMCVDIAAGSIEHRWSNSPPQPSPVGEAASQTPQAKLYEDIFSRPSYWSHFPDRFMCQFSDEMLAQMVEPHRIETIRRVAQPSVAKAVPTRKVIHNRLASEFGTEAINRGGGEWSFHGVAKQTEFSLNIDFGGRGNGFRYDVAFPPSTSATGVGCGLSLESSYGFPTGLCDYPIDDELDSLADTMYETIKDIVTLRELLRLSQEV